MKTRTLIATAIVGALSLGLFAAVPVLAKGPGYGGGLREPRAGVWTQGSFVEPEPFFESLRGMGVSVDVRMDRMEGYA